MSDYVPVTEFVTKDSLDVGDPSKKVVGSELDAEFDAIATAVASKLDQTALGGANGLAQLNANAKLYPAQMWANVSAPSIDTATVTYDCTASNSFYTVLTENVTIAAPTDPVNGQTIWILIKQDGTGSWTVTWNAVFCFPAGSAPTQTATADKADMYTATYNATLTKWIVTYAQNYTVT
jgi:hypothetical protein